MTDKHFLRACICFVNFDQGRSAAEACRNIRQTYGAKSTSESNVRRLFARFKEGNQSLSDDERSHRP